MLNKPRINQSIAISNTLILQISRHKYIERGSSSTKPFSIRVTQLYCVSYRWGWLAQTWMSEDVLLRERRTHRLRSPTDSIKITLWPVSKDTLCSYQNLISNIEPHFRQQDYGTAPGRSSFFFNSFKDRAGLVFLVSEFLILRDLPIIVTNFGIYFCWRDSPLVGLGLLIHGGLFFLDHTQRHTTVGRTPLDEWSARRRDLYLTSHNTHNRQASIPPRWDSNPRSQQASGRRPTP